MNIIGVGEDWKRKAADWKAGARQDPPAKATAADPLTKAMLKIGNLAPGSQ